MFGVLCLLVVCLFLAPQLAFANIGEGVVKVLNVILGGFVKGLEMLLGLFQWLFLMVIKVTILDFATQWEGDGALSGFRVVWQILRDFVNLVIVVVFVLTAMMTTIDNGRFGFHRKGLLYLIGAAIFVNFSAFVTLLVIDISHITFLLFFNSIDATSWGSMSPFQGYSTVLGKVADPTFNLIVALITIVVNWFIILGILYFCIILIERYVIAMFLVLLSPFAMLGFFTSMSGGNKLVSKFSGFYESWVKKLGYVFTMPVILILGFTLLLVLFRGALGSAVSPDNFVSLLGVDNPEGRNILLQLILASIVLIYGMFKVGIAAKESQSIVGKKLGGEKLGAFIRNPKAQWNTVKAAGKSLMHPAGRGVAGWKQKLYEQRKSWDKKGSALGKIPGIGKPLDIGGRVERTKKRVQGAGEVLSAMGEGKAIQDAPQMASAEAAEDKRIMDIVNGYDFDAKKELVKQMLDPKSKVTAEEKYTDRLVQNTNPELRLLLSKLEKGISQGAMKRISSDTAKDAERIAGEEEEFGRDRVGFSDEYEAKRAAFESARIAYQGVNDEYKALKGERDALEGEVGGDQEKMQHDWEANKAERLQEAQQAYQGAQAKWDAESNLENRNRLLSQIKNQEGIVENHRRTGNTELEGEANGVLAGFQQDLDAADERIYNRTGLSPDTLEALRDEVTRVEGEEREVDLSGPEFAEQRVKIEQLESFLNDAAGRRESAKNVLVDATREQNDERVKKGKADKTTEDRFREDRRQVTEIFSNLATNTAAGVAVAGDAAAVFDSDTFDDAQKARESVVAGEMKDWRGMKDGYTKATKGVEDALQEEKDKIEKEDAEGDEALSKTMDAYAKERVKDPDSDAVTPALDALQKEIDALRKASGERRERSQKIDERLGAFKRIKKDLNENEATDAEKLTILGRAASSATESIQEGSIYLETRLGEITKEMKTIEDDAKAKGTDLSGNDAYKELQDKKDLFKEHREGMQQAADGVVNSVHQSLDDYKKVLDSPEYKNLLSREKYLSMFTVKTLLADVKTALKEREKAFADDYEKKNKKKPPKNAYKMDTEWKDLDAHRKNLEKIEKESGATPEMREAAEKAQKAAKGKGGGKKS